MSASVVESVAGPIYSALRSLLLVLLRYPPWWQQVSVPLRLAVPASEDDDEDEKAGERNQDGKAEEKDASTEAGDTSAAESTQEREQEHDQQEGDQEHIDVNCNKNKRWKSLDVEISREKSRIKNKQNIGNGSKKKSKAVKISPTVSETKDDDDESVFSSVCSDGAPPEQGCFCAQDLRKPGGGPRVRRSSESIGVASNTCPVSGSTLCQPRSILKGGSRRGRSMSESNVAHMQDDLSHQDDCPLEEEEEEEEESSIGSKKSVTFSDVEKLHLFMSKASIVNQLANDDKKAMRLKMKDQKKKIRIEKRQVQKSGGSSTGSFKSGYRDNNGYNSFDEQATEEEESEAGGDLCSSSTTAGETTTTDTDDSCSESTSKAGGPSAGELRKVLYDRRGGNAAKRKGGGRKNNKRRVDFTNSMIFQLDMEA